MINNKNIFSILLVTSLIGITFQSQLSLGSSYDTALLILLGFGPLVYYRIHLGNKETLTQNEIDSIYYFGFLVTLIVLGATALRLVTLKAQIESIAAHFGLGLLATGFGLWSRLSLLSKDVTAEASDELLQRQLDHIGQMTERFSETIDLFKNLRAEALNKSQEAINSTTAAALQKLSDQLSVPLQELSKNINDVSESFDKFDAKIFTEIQTNAQILSTSIPPASNSISLLKNNLVELNASLNPSTEQLSVFQNTLKTSNEKLQEVPNFLNQVKTSASDFKSTLNEANLALQQFTKIDFNEIPKLVLGYAAVSSEISKITEEISKAPKTIDTDKIKFVTTLDNLSSDLKNKSDELNLASKILTDALSKMAYSIHNAIDRLPK